MRIFPPTADNGRRVARGMAAFTMVEIAICLAIIGFALVAIIGVLPIGMNVQKDNREQTLINYDANYLMSMLRSGAQDTNLFGASSLTNYLIGITNYSTTFNSNGAVVGVLQENSYTVSNFNLSGGQSGAGLTNDSDIIGILSTPKYVFPIDSKGDYASNYITADFRAISGSALDQGTSDDSRNFAFTYRVTVEITPSANFAYAYNDETTANLSAPGTAPLVVTGNAADFASVSNAWLVAKNQQANLRNIRLHFRWPILPNGQTGPSSATYRSAASGAIQPIHGAVPKQLLFYFVTPQGYTNSP
jgi:type II secretory pathway pseudopilin PulG